jgi:hypothetical protein
MANQIEQIRLAFHESFAAAFANTLRLNVILPIMIAVLVIVLMGRQRKSVEALTVDSSPNESFSK